MIVIVRMRVNLRGQDGQCLNHFYDTGETLPLTTEMVSVSARDLSRESREILAGLKLSRVTFRRKETGKVFECYYSSSSVVYTSLFDVMSKHVIDFGCEGEYDLIHGELKPLYLCCGDGLAFIDLDEMYAVGIRSKNYNVELVEIVGAGKLKNPYSTPTEYMNSFISLNRAIFQSQHLSVHSIELNV